MQQQKSLGRGLSSLIPALGMPKNEAVYFECSIDQIAPNRDQPRRLFQKESLEELADSIREQGVIQPLIVKKMEGDRYELIAGERRLRASKLAGLEKVPVVVMEVSPNQNLELALIENIQRQDLNPIEEALAYKQLIDRYHYTQEQLSKKIGKDRSTVANLIRLLQLPEEIRSSIIEGNLSMGQARPLLSLENVEDQKKIAEAIVEEGLSVRQVEDWVRRLKEERPESVLVKEKSSDPQIDFLESEMTKILGTKVKIQSKGQRGRVLIDYYSNEDLDRIFNALIG